MLKWFTRTLMFVFGMLIGTQLGVRALLRYRPLPVPAQFGGLFGHPLRMLYRDPARVVDFAAVRKNATVLDLGCGTGLFSVELARRIGGNGLLHAVDFQADMIAHTRRRLDAAQLQNVQLSVAPAETLPIESASVDTAVLISMLAETRDKDRVLREVRRVLKPGATLVIGAELIEPEYVRPDTSRKWAERNGFQLVARNGNSFAYMLKFVKPVNPLNVAA